MARIHWLLASALFLTAAEAQAQRRLVPMDDIFSAATAQGTVGGGVTVLVRISPEGRVMGCDVTYRTASAMLGARTCEIIRAQARYGPADARGAVLQDEVAVRWEGAPLRAAVSLDYGGASLTSRSLVSDLDYQEIVRRVGEAEIPLRFTIGANGRIASCRAATSSGSAELDRYTCSLIQARARFRMPVDEAGRTFATEGRMTIKWRRPAA